jgi:hypothetical protein
MYICQYTGKTIGPGIPSNKIVEEKRRKIYERKVKRGRNKGQIELIEGWEIVKEMIVGPDAYRKLTGLEPAQVSNPSILHPNIKPIENEKPARKRKPWKNSSQKTGYKNTKTGSSHSQTRPTPQVEKVHRVKKNSLNNGTII